MARGGRGGGGGGVRMTALAYCFREWLQSKWPVRFKLDPLDHWHIVSSKLRRAIKGWG